MPHLAEEKPVLLWCHSIACIHLPTAMHIRLELGGGLELLFGGSKAHDLDLPGDGQEAQWTLGKLIPWVRDKLLTERPELFMKGETVRPGILVLINDCDWELSGTLDSVLSDGDVVTFISTLHGG